MARKSTEVTVTEPSEKPDVYSVMRLLDATSAVETAQKKFKLAGATMDIEARRSTAVSTGMLMTDLILNGGIYPGGWYTFFGPEGSSKSTQMNTAMISMFYSDVPVVAYFDSEGSSSPDYIESIAKASNVNRTIDIKKVFGVKDPKKGTWAVEPRIWYYPESSLEGIWNSIAAILRRLPDKMYIDGEWWLLFDRTKENISRFKGQGNTKIGDQYGKIAIPSMDGGTAQALFIIDSFANMVSDSDDDDDGNNSLGLEARGHSKHAKKVKGRLKRKHATLIGVNQLREKPMVTHGPTEYEPGGNALRFSSDCRISNRPRAVPHASGQIEEEDSVLFNGGTDTYRYILARTIKNKFGPPFLEAWYRIWVSDPKGEGHGLDPVWDTYQYLKSTGQISGSMGKTLTVTLPHITIEKIKWLDFKALILMQGDELKAYCKQLGIAKNPRIRETCFEQVRDGSGTERYFRVLHGLEEDIEFDQMTDEQLVAYVLDEGLTNKRAVKKMNRDDLLELIESAGDESDENGDEDADIDEDDE